MEYSGRNEKRIKRGEEGFTLIEIMIVVTILGLLVGLVAVNAPSILHANRVKTARMNIQMLQDKIDIFYADTGKFPTDLNELVKFKLKDGTDLQIIKKVPKDPWGNDFVYVVPGKENEDYSISSLGGDGQAGGEGKNADIDSWELDKVVE